MMKDSHTVNRAHQQANNVNQSITDESLIDPHGNFKYQNEVNKNKY